MPILTRRTFLATSLAAAGAMPAMAREFSAVPVIRVTKDPNCGCCAGWVQHVRASGFRASVTETQDLAPLKARLGVPASLASCHTAEVEGYVLEGHVPAAAIKRLLIERPEAKGLAVPGMPVGSPGMEVGGVPDEAYEVILFGPSGQRIFARFRGGREI